MKVKTKLFEYGDRELNYLKQADPILGQAIDSYGKIDRIVIPDLFQALVHAIIGQQISLKAADTVWNKVQERFDITPEYFIDIPKEELQQCGMSMRKADYILGIAHEINNGNLDLNSLYKISDQEVIKKLSSLKGIGVWTAEMLLLNSMERPDVVSYGDMAIRRGMMTLYGLNDLSKEEFNAYRSKYSPYGSVASIYLWQISKQ